MPSASIFVTDEHPEFVDLIKDVLVDAGYVNTVAHLGDNVLQRICDERPALILLDISVSNPGHGWSILDVVRLPPETRTIPVILRSTKMRLLEGKVELLTALNCQTLEKPFELEMLLDTIAGRLGYRQRSRLYGLSSHNEATMRAPDGATSHCEEYYDATTRAAYRNEHYHDAGTHPRAIPAGQRRSPTQYRPEHGLRGTQHRVESAPDHDRAAA